MSALRAGIPITHRDRLPSTSRYELLLKIASGGMATVYVGRLSSAIGVTRLVAIKRAHAHLLEDGSFGKMLIAEARLASRIHHPNAVAVQNVEELEGELLLVMDYVEGASLAELVNHDTPPLPPPVALRVLLDACAGLHAAHMLEGNDGKLLGIVHRDVSPHNILVGLDGITRLTDFGIAKPSGGSTESASRTSTGALKGKVAYMAPEYVDSGTFDRRSDLFALGVVAWEALTRQRLFRGANEVESLRLVLACDVPAMEGIPPGVEAVVRKALARDPNARFDTAAELGEALEVAARREGLVAGHASVGGYVKEAAGEALEARRHLIRDESEASTGRLSFDEKTRETPAPGAGTGSVVGRAEGTAPLERPPSSHDGESAGSAVVPAESNTLGSGVSRHMVDEANAPPAPASPRRRRAPFVVFGIGLALVLVAVGVMVPVIRTSPRGSNATASSGDGPPPRATASSASAGASASTTSAAPAAPLSSASSSTPPDAIASAPKASAGRFVPPRPPPPRPAAKPVASPVPEPSGDRAPPNPYAH